MSAKSKLDLQDAKSIMVTVGLLFSPVLIVFLEQAQTMEFNWNILWAMFIWIILKTIQKYTENNPK